MAPGVSTKLPIGQTEISDFPRWGLVEQWPTIPARPTLMLGGDVSTPYELALDDLATAPQARTDECCWSSHAVRPPKMARFRYFQKHSRSTNPISRSQLICTSMGDGTSNL